MVNYSVYKIKYKLVDEKQLFCLPAFESGLDASLKYRELVANNATITILLFKNGKIIDETIKEKGVILY